jgi:hypothetical protein
MKTYTSPGMDRTLFRAVAWMFLLSGAWWWIPAAEPSTTEVRRPENQHWSFQPIRPPTLPEVRNKGWVRNSIDTFILAKLEREKVQPSPDADRYTLIRRLSLDLTGLPPTPEEVNEFVGDTRDNAYEVLVDRLLSSPHFGEQWARHWLDLARYADTDGYEKDFYRPHAWRWRDWVIESINRDQPFDEFTREQIAGDLLPNATLAQRVATGFHRNTLLNREGGVDIEEDRCKIVVDRVSTVGAAWLGLTIGCAECHNHKYDPISQKEFYQMYAFFNSTDDRDIKAPLPARSMDYFQKQSELDEVKQQYVEKADPEMEAWESKIAAVPDLWFTPKVEDYDLPTFGANNGANLYPQEDGSFLVTGMIENKTHYIMMLNTRLKGITGIRVEAMTDDMLPKLGPGWAKGNFVLSELYVETASLQAVNNLKTNPLERAFADYSQPGYPVSAAIDSVTAKGGWAVDMPQLAMHGVDRCAVFVTKEDLGYEEGTRLKISLVQNEGKSHTLGRVRVTYTTADRASLADHAVPQRIKEIARIPSDQRTLEQKATLKRYYQATFQTDAPELAAFTKVLAEAPGVKGEVQAPTLSERRISRPTHIHVRGEFMNKGAEVQPGMLAVLPPLKPREQPGERNSRPDRLDLANWLIDPANPLTPRVTVNVFWMHLFGEGLVPTAADFGTQGERPSHPALLDWLATEFIKRGWSRKQMIKLIVMSATYRQSSATREDLREHDALNRLFARQNRFRLSAENARDQYLAAGGLLDPTIGGASVTPASKRRGLYLQVKRAHIDYLLTTFDAPNTTQACPKRERSNTPLQALTLLNDKLFIQSAQALAQRTGQGPAVDPGSRIRRLFQFAVARPPSPEDGADLIDLFHRVRAAYESAPEQAKKVAGDVPPETLSTAEAAAWVVVARAILNLDELITRD